MTQNVSLNPGDRAIEPFFDAIQELLSGAAPALQLSVLNSTTVTVVAGTGDAQQSASIMGRYRYITASITAAHPGGGTGIYDVYITGSDNDFTLGGATTVDRTVYAFALSIRDQATRPSTALYRKIGEVDWNGSAITGLRVLVGSRADAAPLTPTAPTADVTPLRVRGVAGQSGALAKFENSTGVALVAFPALGGVSLMNSGPLTWNGATRIEPDSPSGLVTNGRFRVAAELEVDGALDHDGTTVGFYGVTPAARSSPYAATGHTASRTIDFSNCSLDEVVNVLGALIDDLRRTGLIG